MIALRNLTPSAFVPAILTLNFSNLIKSTSQFQDITENQLQNGIFTTRISLPGWLHCKLCTQLDIHWPQSRQFQFVSAAEQPCLCLWKSNAVSSHRFVLSSTNFSSVLHRRNGMATAAARSSDALERSLRRLDNDVKRVGRISRRDIEDILEEIRLNRSASSSQSLLVIRCCGNLVPEEPPETRTALVQEIWKTLNNLNVQMDISHYNALLRVYLENEHEFSPTEFLAELETKGVEPNR